jgi:hypothetical protein
MSSLISCKTLKFVSKDKILSVNRKNEHNIKQWISLRKRLFPDIRDRHLPFILQFNTLDEVTLETECDEKNQSEKFFVNGTEFLNQIKILENHAFLLTHPITFLKMRKEDLTILKSMNDSVVRQYLGYTFKSGPLISSYFLPSFSEVSKQLKEVNSFLDEKTIFQNQSENRENFIQFLNDLVYNLRSENIEGVKGLLQTKMKLKKIAFFIDILLSNLYSIIVFLRGVTYVLSLLNIVSMPFEIVQTIYSVLAGNEITAAWTTIFMFLAYYAYKNPGSSNRINSYKRDDVETMLQQDKLLHEIINGESFEDLLDKYIKTPRSASGVNSGTMGFNRLEAYERLYFVFTNNVADFDIFNKDDENCEHCKFSACVNSTLPFHICRKR